MNYKKILLPVLLGGLLLCGISCQQSQQTDFNTYGRRVAAETLKNAGPEFSFPSEPAIPGSSKTDNRIYDTRDSTASQILLGNPSGATNSTVNAENYLIDQQYYVESYSRTKGSPNWVSWHIGAEDLGNTKRLNNFRPDTDLPEGWYEVSNTSYKGSGFDKGHNCPSGDRSSSTAANSSTFLMNNMIPQAPNNNQHTWEHLESYCRTQVKKGNEVYVVMGSYGSGGTGKNGYFESIDNGKINVPAHIWKVVVIIPEGNNDLQRINAGTRIIAVDTPNDNAIAPNWMKYLCTVRDIEKATGYDLLSALPKALQNRIEVEKFKGGN
ncbi:MAG: DNA/RNA non-specific endonuclease [Pedobacter sp.]|uniref:DNA/RNA non-specific endonuclease n=1 Tax=Pedobacter sp. TaxID=1411316 RepID=UPI003399DF60